LLLTLAIKLFPVVFDTGQKKPKSLDLKMKNKQKLNLKVQIVLK